MKRSLDILLAAFLMGPAALAQAHSQPDGEQPRIEVRISATQVTIRPGDTLKLHVEIWNVGTASIFVCKDFDASAPPCSLRFQFEDAAKHEYSYMGGSATDCGVFGPGPGRPEDFANALITSWLPLEPNHFYGGMTYINTSSLGKTLKPGVYRVQERFFESGMDGWNCGSLEPWASQVARLRAKPFQGWVDSNALSVRVITAKSR